MHIGLTRNVTSGCGWERIDLDEVCQPRIILEPLLTSVYIRSPFHFRVIILQLPKSVGFGWCSLASETIVSNELDGSNSRTAWISNGFIAMRKRLLKLKDMFLPSPKTFVIWSTVILSSSRLNFTLRII